MTISEEQFSNISCLKLFFLKNICVLLHALIDKLWIISSRLFNSYIKDDVVGISVYIRPEGFKKEIQYAHSLLEG